jgi:hypothetical protein
MVDGNDIILPGKVGAVPATTNYRRDLQVFEEGLMNFISQHGLPSENVLVPVTERVRVFANLEDVLTLLDDGRKPQSVYVSKFLAASASGLFDAALNYLWDETIYELRKRVARYDLDYFFDLAVSNPDKRKKLTSEDDLVKLDDSELIKGATEIGLVSELGYKHLDYIRFMRNWASAAHPNQNQITGLQLVAWLETCVKEVIALPETNTTGNIKFLLSNVRSRTLDATVADQICRFFVDLTADQSNNLLAGFFGIYTNETSLPLARDNVRLLAPRLWPLTGESMRQNLGIKYGQFVANGDTSRAKWAREFLDGVDGASYIPDGIRAAEIGTAVDELLVAHRAPRNNFYIEPSFARRLAALVGEKGQIPQQIVERYVEGLVEAYLTNGNGVAWDAEPTYKHLLGLLDSSQALLAVLSFRKVHIASKLQLELCQQKYRDIVALAKSKVSSPQGSDVISFIEGYKAPLHNMRHETRLMERINAITASLGFGSGPRRVR